MWNMFCLKESVFRVSEGNGDFFVEEFGRSESSSRHP